MASSELGTMMKDEKVWLETRQEPDAEPRSMKLADVSRAAATNVETLEGGDPVFHYTNDTPDKKNQNTRLRRISRRFTFIAMWTYLVYKREAWTIQGGKSNLGYTDPGVRSSPFGKILDFLFNAIYVGQKFFNTKQQNMRYDEFRTKTNEAIERELGNRKDKMLVLNTIATTPSMQGHGYGTALIKALNAKADLDRRATMLISSNVKANTGFYNSLGFQTVATVFLGDDPDWHESLVPVAIMVREPKNADA